MEDSEYARVVLAIYRFLKKEKIVCINCHSLPVLPLCVALKKRHKCKLIYDTHELETETDGSSGIRKLLSKLVEKILIRYVNETITVCNSIAEWYSQAYGLQNVWVVKNVPHRQDIPPDKSRFLREKFKIPDDHIVFLYQGVLNQVRGTDFLLRVFSEIGADKHIVFMGFGSSLDEVKKKVR